MSIYRQSKSKQRFFKESRISKENVACFVSSITAVSRLQNETLKKHKCFLFNGSC